MMRHTNNKSLFVLAVLLLLLFGCGSSSSSSNAQTPCDKSSMIRGTIVSVSPPISGSSPAGLLIDGTKEKNAQFDKVYVSVLTNGQIFEKQGQECHSVPVSALNVGQRVQIQSTGTIRQSYPPQIDATEIVILP